MQGASLETLIASHEAWQGKVVGVVVNKSGSESGLPTCSNLMSLRLLQDDKKGNLWAMMGVLTGGMTIVDGQGKLVFRDPAGSLPNSAAQIETLVNGLLGL